MDYIYKLQCIDKACKTLVVLLEASDEDIVKRCIEHDEKDLDFNDASILKTHKELFKKYYTLYSGDKLQLNTSKLSIKECVEIILDAITQLY